MSDLIKPEQIIDRLHPNPGTLDEVRQEVRYTKAIINCELTKLEGAQI